MPSARQGVAEIPYICYAYGINHVVISSGSRCAPLILSFVSHRLFRCISITDERSAAYYALGMAQQLQKPVALVCTSGTAVANYSPALAEALYLKVPLLVLSADRPSEWIDQNDGQTIRQFEIFRNVVKKSFQLPVETEKEEDLWNYRRTLNEAISTSILDVPGPVHVNIPLREPLYNTLPDVINDPRIIELNNGVKNLSEDKWHKIVESWKKFRRKLVVCGLAHLKNIEVQNLLNKMSSSYEVVVVAENLSNLYGETFIDTPDRFMASLDHTERDEFQPDLLITIGGSIISKKLKKYLRQYKPIEHWHIDENAQFIDTFQCLSNSIGVLPELFFSKVIGQGVTNLEFSNLVSQKRFLNSSKHNEFIHSAEFSDLKAWDAIIGNLPSNINLHLANSTPVRYAQLFASRSDISYFSNRGTSGIDGCVSTAAGAATVSRKLNVLLLGDMAFVYDSNGLWNNNLSPNLRIVVMDNGGGNIFRLIETGPELTRVIPYIEIPHKVKIDSLCDAYGVEYHLAEDMDSLKQKFERFYEPSDKPRVLHIKTSGRASAKIFKDYYQHISNS
jgi:2-succinyl-5-enolpyruvyl-6-hydroxy-3-cyclohexene-1-carboxylate synthase